VRVATVADAAGIAAVHVASWRAAYRGLLPDELLDGLEPEYRIRRWSRLLSELDPARAVLVLLADGEIAGFASVGPRRGGPADEGELRSLYLHPDRWGQRLGHRLHGEALAWLDERGFDSATLWVLVGNRRALDFYLREGWREDGVTRTDTGPSGVELPELQLRRPLSGSASA
jgi:GNAT superfamily N-acetyltransferase